MMRNWVWIFGFLLLSSCTTMPTPPPTQEEGITLRMSYNRAFDKVMQLLESRGYTVALADKQVGIIETHPRRVAGETGEVHHKVLLSLLLRGDRNETVVYTRVIVTSDYPEEEDQILNALRGLSP